MTREERLKKLQENKQRELAKYATTLGVKGAHDLKKADLIEAILLAEDLKECIIHESAVDKEGIDNQIAGVENVEVEIKTEKQSTGIVDEQKLVYIESVEVGVTIVAFNVDGKVRSAKVIKKSTKRHRFMVETAYGAQYVVPYADIIWVRTGHKWPRGVYRMLKGIEVSGNEKAD